MRIRLILFSLFFPMIAYGQVDEFLVSYSVTEESKAAFIRWTTSAGFQCEDIVIEHGTDSNNLNTIYTYPGICGSTDKEEHYNFVFRDVTFNTPNYFRINLGRFGVSPLLKLTIISATGLNPKVYPNPATVNSVLLFDNSNREEATIKVYSLAGQEVGQTIVTFEETVTIGRFNVVTTGTYIYVIELKGIKLRGKFYLL